MFMSLCPKVELIANDFRLDVYVMFEGSSKAPPGVIVSENGEVNDFDFLSSRRGEVSELDNICLFVSVRGGLVAGLRPMIEKN